MLKNKGSVRLPGADETKNAFEVFKTQFENFSKLKISKILYNVSN